MHQNQQLSRLYPNVQYFCQCLPKFTYCWIPCSLRLRRYADRISWWKYKFGQKVHWLRGWRRSSAPSLHFSRHSDGKRANEGWASIRNSGESGRMQAVRKWSLVKRERGGGWGDLCWFFLWPDCICDSPIDTAICFSVLASHPSFVSRVGCLMSVGEKWDWKAKQHNYWTEIPSDCFVMDCLPTLGHRLPARLIQLLCRLDCCPHRMHVRGICFVSRSFCGYLLDTYCI